LDRLRSAQRQREHYVGTWLPEPMVEHHADAPATPEELVERADTLSVAFLAVLERLAPQPRAGVLLRGGFDAHYAQGAAPPGRSEAACRQLVHRAKAAIQEERPRFRVARDRQMALLRSFAEASARGDLQGLKALLAEDVALIGDGGGKVPSFGRPLVG